MLDLIGLYFYYLFLLSLLSLLPVLILGVLSDSDRDLDFLIESPLDDTLLRLIFRSFFIPVYVFVIYTIPFWSPVMLYQKYDGVKNFTNKVGTAVKNFFQKKPLASLKNFKIRIERVK